MAPLQRRALIALIIGSVFAAALIVVLMLESDVTAFGRGEHVRWVVYSALKKYL